MTKTPQESHSHIPTINISALISGTEDRQDVAARIGQACRDYGFFYVVGHGVDEHLQRRLEEVSQRFFAQDLETKLQIGMSRGGRAWRGYFPVGAELTSGKPDLKEGVYFGAELTDDHPLVRAGTPLHGPNLFPSNIPEFREIVLDYMAAMTKVGHCLVAGISLSLGLEESYFADRYTLDPLILFRIFNYPSPSLNRETESNLGVGEHTDYGLLTILKQDMSGGLQVKTKSGWVAAPPIPNAFVCNIGDMLDRMTGGHYLSTSQHGRIRMDWPRLLAYITGTVDQELLLRNEYLAAENRILKAQLQGRLLLSDARGSHWPRSVIGSGAKLLRKWLPWRNQTPF
jgi:isopenicillin N synthase-like dioxygenase